MLFPIFALSTGARNENNFILLALEPGALTLLGLGGPEPPRDAFHAEASQFTAL